MTSVAYEIVLFFCILCCVYCQTGKYINGITGAEFETFKDDPNVRIVYFYKKGMASGGNTSSTIMSTMQ